MVGINISLAGADWQLQTTITVPSGPIQVKDLIPMVQSFADQVVRGTVRSVEESGQNISCKKGCGACCRQLVPISEVEARRIHDVVTELPEPRQSEIRRRFAAARRRLEESGLLKRLVDRGEFVEGDVQSFGVEYFRQGIPCPFLENESCSIHPDRPSVCREYLVTSPAENCAAPSVKTIDQVNMPFKIWPALARFDKVHPGEKLIRWVPLVLALEWSIDHPDETQPRPGPELLHEFFRNLAGKGEAAPKDAPSPSKVR
ncbi:MAG: YkgJ family cysteine cluster protein [Deltaproteobacteria bacterium]|nr:YkgJ family cysteine cluster protein [Deltaproteobacteria bacterium]MDZ4345656.1 YkgJ family cysteine cluster protein [Candidatus Binatia bacterium]